MMLYLTNVSIVALGVFIGSGLLHQIHAYRIRPKIDWKRIEREASKKTRVGV